ncbi:hypothetical protein Acor_15290 [Acrocarpospora corrugata]|uniref:Nicotinamide mononucleotide transporter n=1 Tax=Acrocarpospora corrugata TaxID=35763 RepID=A0A5M3VS40_9ACTN|nr:nicotinamide mononucleotide transporter family protein [Acrocarpospora corrugata]GER99465.1 hypothetical protein Acor_15290 [Acrocarpospora corrugata]
MDDYGGHGGAVRCAGSLLEPAITLGGVSTSWAELLGFATGALTVWLVVRQHVWNWPIGVANVILLGLVFLTVGLYADAALQIVSPPT